MKSIFKGIALVSALSFTTSTLAIPTLQVGVSDGAGGYLAYTASGTSPTENDTAYTSGSSIVVGGAYSPNSDTLIGGRYSTGPDWSSFGFDSSFDGKGAVLMASASNTSGNLTIDGWSSFFTTTTNFFPNNHAPLGSASSFMFFDILNFAKNLNTVTDFTCTSGCTTATGELKNLTLGGTSGYDWIHFDVMALVTDEYGQEKLKTTVDNNPGSHDVTWKYPSITITTVPEPSTPLLLAVGMMGLLIVRKAQSRRQHKVALT